MASETRIGQRLARLGKAVLARLPRLSVPVLAGLLLTASFAPLDWWWAAVVAFGLLAWALTRARMTPLGGLGYGFVFGLAFYVPLLPWVGKFVGAMPWLVLASVCAAFPALFGLLAVTVRRLPGWPLWFAILWVAQEWLKCTVPFGGFPWGVVGFGQTDGPLLPLARLGGAPLLSLGIVLVGCSATAVGCEFVSWWHTASRRRSQSGSAPPAVVLPGISICLVLLAAIVIWPQVRHSGVGSGNESTVTVAAVQGNVPRLGLTFNAQRRAVLDNHVRETMRLADDVHAGPAPQPQIVVWPENSSDIDPLVNADAGREISAAATTIGAPILVGTVLDVPNRPPDSPQYTNTVIVWDPATGPADRHNKQIVQPFGEYLPWPSFFRRLSGFASLAGQLVPGKSSGVVHAAGVPVGVATCWEVIFDRASRESVLNGAQLLVVPANNATFNQTMSEQQLAFAKERAVEHDRYVVVAGTVGISAVIAPDGHVLDRTDFFVPAYLDSQVRLKTSLTPATRWGPIVPWTLVGAALAIVLVAMRHNSTSTADNSVRAGRDTRQRNQMTMSQPASRVPGNRPSQHALVIIPTFNERENLPLILERLLQACPGAHVLVVDDDSPDGTGQLADELAQADPGRIHVLHRTTKNGLGAAYLAGFAWGLGRQYSVLVEMDADGSHAPEQLDRLLDAVDAGADLAIGSRYVDGGVVRNWPWRRLALSKTANTYSRLLLGIGVHDVTAGFRAYRRDVLETIDLDAVDSKGYCFQIDLTWRVVSKGFAVVEVPITFTERELGVSKMSGSNIREALVKVTRWGIAGRMNRARAVRADDPVR